jgi:hypothetical protein
MPPINPALIRSNPYSSLAELQQNSTEGAVAFSTPLESAKKIETTDKAEVVLNAVTDEESELHLTPKQEAAVFEEVFKDFGAFLDNNYGGESCNYAFPLRGLQRAEYVFEKSQRVRVGNKTIENPCATLLFKLYDHYTRTYGRENADFTFSEFLTSSTLEQFRGIWKLDKAPGEYWDEMIRRFYLGVRMLSTGKREKYSVQFKNGLLYWAKWKGLDPFDMLDTVVPEFFRRKHEKTSVDPGDRIAIYVLSDDDVFYTHSAKLHRFHHTSFVKGDAIKAAGEWRVESGQLKWISSASGHYKPTGVNLQTAIDILKKYDVRPDSYNVHVWVDPDKYGQPRQLQAIRADKFRELNEKAMGAFYFAPR